MCVRVCFYPPARGFQTEELFEEFVRTSPDSGKVLAAVVFEHPFTYNDEPLPLKVKRPQSRGTVLSFLV